jgi:hypothetical protein
MYTGSCLCGGVAYEIDGELEPIQVCHCSQCRKAQGTAIVTNIPVGVCQRSCRVDCYFRQPRLVVASLSQD